MLRPVTHELQPCKSSSGIKHDVIYQSKKLDNSPTDVTTALLITALATIVVIPTVIFIPVITLIPFFIPVITPLTLLIHIII
jgi:hypothetical protein